MDNIFVQIYLGICAVIFFASLYIWYERRMNQTLGDYPGIFEIGSFDKVIVLSMPVVNLFYSAAFLMLVWIIGILDFREKWASDQVTVTTYYEDVDYEMDGVFPFWNSEKLYRRKATKRVLKTGRVNRCRCGETMDVNNAVVSKISDAGYAMTCSSCGQTLLGQTQGLLIDLWNDQNDPTTILDKMLSKMSFFERFIFRVKFALTYYTTERPESNIFDKA